MYAVRMNALTSFLCWVVVSGEGTFSINSCLSHFLNALQELTQLCTQFRTRSDVKFVAEPIGMAISILLRLTQRYERSNANSTGGGRILTVPQLAPLPF